LSESPIVCPVQQIQPDWIDYNGHLNMAFYSVLFDRAVDHIYDQFGIGVDYVENQGGSYRSAPFPHEIHGNITRLMESQEGLAIPDQVGHVIGIR